MEQFQIIGFVLIATLLVISPGPNGLLIAKTVATSGKKAGFANIAGFLAAFYLHGSLSVLGISVLLTKSADAFMVVKVLGAVYLGWIGVKSLLSAFRTTDNQQVTLTKNSSQSVIKSFSEGLLTNALNPKVSMFYLAAFPQFIPVGQHSVTYAFVLVSLHALINVMWFSSMVVLFSRFKTIGQSHTAQRILKTITDLAFIGFGGKLLALESK